MITDINFYRDFLSFINSKGTRVKFFPRIPYTGIVSIFQVKNGIVLVLNWGEESTLEERRRNVIKIDEEGKILWVVQDKIHAWQKKFPSVNKKFLDSEKGACFDVLYTENEKIILRDGGGALFFLDPATGAIEHWKTERW